ncbi:virulence factor Mce [Mycobacterium avium subsp. paratuberculosis]|nr:virulence factor Mce [Mycobacterium avium subsp. paratuberculosis]
MQRGHGQLGLRHQRAGQPAAAGTGDRLGRIPAQRRLLQRAEPARPREGQTCRRRCGAARIDGRAQLHRGDHAAHHGRCPGPRRQHRGTAFGHPARGRVRRDQATRPGRSQRPAAQGRRHHRAAGHPRRRHRGKRAQLGGPARQRRGGPQLHQHRQRSRQGNRRPGPRLRRPDQPDQFAADQAQCPLRPNRRRSHRNGGAGRPVGRQEPGDHRRAAGRRPRHRRAVRQRRRDR